MYIFGSGEENIVKEKKNETKRTWLDLRLLRHTHNTHTKWFPHTHTQLMFFCLSQKYGKICLYFAFNLIQFNSMTDQCNTLYLF